MFFNTISYLKERPDLIFWACALFGSVLFVLRMLTSFFVHSGDDDFNCDASCGHDGVMDGLDSHDSIEHNNFLSSFNFFTMHSVAGFFMMFGWTGLACFKQLELGHLKSIMVAFTVGIITMFL